MLRQLLRIRSIISAQKEKTVGVDIRKSGILGCIVDLIKPKYKDLSKPELLSKCTHGLTQNVNECLTTLSGIDVLSLLMLRKRQWPLPPTLAPTTKASEDCDNSRIEVSPKKSSEKVKKRRKLLRHLRTMLIVLKRKKVSSMNQVLSRQYMSGTKN
jgi:hypothetical protein